MQDYTYTSTPTADAAAGAAFGAFFVGYLIFLVVLYLVVSYILSRVFTKAGKPAWAAFVPIYNGWVLFEIGGQPGWWILLGLIPIIGGLILFVMTIIVSLEIAKRFGKSSAFGIIGLWLFSIIGYAILAFDDSKYQGTAEATAKTSAAANVSTQASSSSDSDKPSQPLVQ